MCYSGAENWVTIEPRLSLSVCPCVVCKPGVGMQLPLGMYFLSLHPHPNTPRGVAIQAYWFHPKLLCHVDAFPLSNSIPKGWSSICQEGKGTWGTVAPWAPADPSSIWSGAKWGPQGEAVPLHLQLTGRLAALFSSGLLCSSAQARSSCLRPQGCTNSTAGQRLCIFKQLLKGHIRSGESRRPALASSNNLCDPCTPHPPPPQSRHSAWIKGWVDIQGRLKALSFIITSILPRGSWAFEADAYVFIRMFWLLDVS